jgi:hypothetical protein
VTFSFHPEARAEFEAAVEYYESCQQGLGWDLVIEVYAAIQSVLSHPAAWPVFDRNARRRLTRRFPFGVVYSVERSEVLILAVMHLHRRPGYWKSRS